MTTTPGRCCLPIYVARQVLLLPYRIQGNIIDRIPTPRDRGVAEGPDSKHPRYIRTTNIRRRQGGVETQMEQQEEGTDLTTTTTTVQAHQLPNDVLADVLCRLPPRSLAASRCACRAWRAAVDSWNLLPPVELLLPTQDAHAPVGGIFYNLGDVETSRFLAHPSVRDDIEGFLDYLEVHSHCNGLLLLEDDVVANPATEERVSLPPRPPLYMGKEYFTCGSFLVFDPAVSPHYEVVSIPRYQDYDDRPAASEKSVEWPPSPLRLHVFSSRTGRWEETSFLREGDPMRAAVPGIPPGFQIDQPYSVYWQGELYA